MSTDTAMLGDSGYERNDRDLYETEAPVTESLVSWLMGDFVSPSDTVWEPAAGRGAMVRIMAPHFKNVIATDIHPLMVPARTLDFLTCEEPPSCQAIITNPPYGDDLDMFIGKAIGFLRRPNDLRLVAYVARTEVDHASTRRLFFGDCPEYLGKLILTWRPRWVERRVGDKGPRHNYSVYLWARIGCYKGVARPLSGYLHRPVNRATTPAFQEAA